MVVLFALFALLSGVADTSARKLLSEPKCEPLKNHLGVFGNHLLAQLKADPNSKDLVRLLESTEYVEGNERKTFFMPEGLEAAQTLSMLQKGMLGPLSTEPHTAQYKMELRQIVLNHIVGKEHRTVGHGNLPTLADESFLIPHKKEGKVYLESCHTGRPSLVKAQAKYDTCVGTVHVVDDILLPHLLLCAANWKQCGGDNWSGPTCCQQTPGQPYECVHQPNNLQHQHDSTFQQCLPTRVFKLPVLKDVVVDGKQGDQTDSKDGHHTDSKDGHTFDGKDGKDGKDGHHTDSKDGHTSDGKDGKDGKDVHQTEGHVVKSGHISVTPKREARLFSVVKDEEGPSPGEELLDEYIAFYGIDYIPPPPNEDKKLIIEDIGGDVGAKLVGSLQLCADECTKLDKCNVISYYNGDNLPNGRNCWLKTADFVTSKLSSCKPPPDAEVNDNAILLFLVGDTCEEPGAEEHPNDHTAVLTQGIVTEQGDGPSSGGTGTGGGSSTGGRTAETDTSSAGTTARSTTTSTTERANTQEAQSNGVSREQGVMVAILVVAVNAMFALCF